MNSKERNDGDLGEENEDTKIRTLKRGKIAQ